MDFKARKNYDLALWSKIRDGNRNAFDELYHFYIQSIFNYGMKISNDQELTKECIQELFVTLWNSKSRLSIEKSVKNYLFLSLKRSLANKLGRRQKSQPLELVDLQNANLLSTDEPFFQENTLKENKNKIDLAFKSLSKRQKEAIFLKYFEDMSYEEISEIMGLNVNGVYKLVSTGIKRLRKEIQETN